MTVKQMENMDLDNVTYYTINVWKDKNELGSEYSIAYKRESNARKIMKQLIDSKKYQALMMRKTEVVKRRIDCEISTSSPIWSWEI